MGEEIKIENMNTIVPESSKTCEWKTSLLYFSCVQNILLHNEESLNKNYCTAKQI
jgi:hypothetical protein